MKVKDLISTAQKHYHDDIYNDPFLSSALMQLIQNKEYDDEIEPWEVIDLIKRVHRGVINI